MMLDVLNLSETQAGLGARPLPTLVVNMLMYCVNEEEEAAYKSRRKRRCSQR